MNRQITGVALALALLGVTTTASAQEGGLAAQGNFVLGADRVVGLTSNKQRIEQPGGDPTATYTGFGFSWGLNATPFNTPRVGLDYFLTDNLSLGGNLGYAELSSDDDNDETMSAFIFSPRVGYMIGLGRVVGFWPRGGFSYYSMSAGDRTQLALTLEAMFSLTPSPGFAIVTGPILDLGFTGEIDTGDETRDYHDRNLGITFGIAGVL